MHVRPQKPTNRQQYNDIQIGSVAVCQEYITKIEDSHEIMMTEVSHFLDLLTSTVHDYHQHLDSMHL